MLAILFLLFPFFTIMFYVFHLWIIPKFSMKNIWKLAVLLSIYLGLLNCTKELSGDFLEYSEYFYDVPKYNLLFYVMGFGKEPLYYAYTWISYYLFFGNWKLFVVSITTINYLLLSYCLIKISRRLCVSSKNIITALFFMAFFFQEFAAVGNLMRQALSEALTLVFLTRLYLDKKYSWWIALCALCVHTSCLPIIGIGLIPSIRKRFTIKTLLKTLIPLSGLVVVFYVLGDYLANVPFIGYIFERANNTEQLLGVDSWQENVGLQPAMSALILLLVVMAVFLYSKMQHNKQTFIEVGLINLNIILVVLMVLCNTIGAYYLLMRYFFYIYAFQSALFLVFIHHNKSLSNDVIRLPLVLMLTLYFFYNYTHNIFSYSTILEATFWPAPVFVL